MKERAIPGADLDRLSENRYFDQFLSHKSFNIDAGILRFCILGQPVENRK